jgi:hypothetical protein
MYNEKWFLARRNMLEAGKVAGELKTQQQWRVMLDGQKNRGHRLIRAIREVSSNFIEGAE